MGKLETFCWKFMLCCISVNKSATEKKHGINLKQWCNYSNVWKAQANYFSVNALGASSQPDLKLPCQPWDTAAPRRGMESSVKNNLPGATRVICVFICDLVKKRKLTNKKQQPAGQSVGKDNRWLGATNLNYMVTLWHVAASTEAGGQCTGVDTKYQWIKSYPRRQVAVSCPKKLEDNSNL